MKIEQTPTQPKEHRFELDKSVPVMITIERVDGVINDNTLEDAVHALCYACGNFHKFTRGELSADATQPGHADILNFVAKNPATQTVYEDKSAA